MVCNFRAFSKKLRPLNLTDLAEIWPDFTFLTTKWALKRSCCFCLVFPMLPRYLDPEVPFTLDNVCSQYVFRPE